MNISSPGFPNNSFRVGLWSDHLLLWTRLHRRSGRLRRLHLASWNGRGTAQQNRTLLYCKIQCRHAPQFMKCSLHVSGLSTIGRLFDKSLTDQGPALAGLGTSLDSETRRCESSSMSNSSSKEAAENVQAAPMAKGSGPQAKWETLPLKYKETRSGDETALSIPWAAQLRRLEAQPFASATCQLPLRVFSSSLLSFPPGLPRTLRFVQEVQFAIQGSLEPQISDSDLRASRSISEHLGAQSQAWTGEIASIPNKFRTHRTPGSSRPEACSKHKDIAHNRGRPRMEVQKLSITSFIRCWFSRSSLSMIDKPGIPAEVGSGWSRRKELCSHIRILKPTSRHSKVRAAASARSKTYYDDAMMPVCAPTTRSHQPTFRADTLGPLNQRCKRCKAQLRKSGTEYFPSRVGPTCFISRVK